MEPELRKQWERPLNLGDTSHNDNASNQKVLASIVTEKYGAEIRLEERTWTHSPTNNTRWEERIKDSDNFVID